MVIVAGHVTVEPQQRESYLASCVRVIEQGRAAAGCLDLAVTDDLVDCGRVNVFERWESQAALRTTITSAPASGPRYLIASISSCSTSATVSALTPSRWASWPSGPRRGFSSLSSTNSALAVSLAVWV